MARDMEPYEKAPGTAPVPYADVPPGYYPDPITSDVPSWIEPVPKYREDSDIQRWWSYIMRWPRFVAIAFLWLTDEWWKSAIAVSTITTFIIIYRSR